MGQHLYSRLACDQCGEAIDRLPAQTRPMLETVQALGWRRVVVDGVAYDLCPACVPQRARSMRQPTMLIRRRAS